MEDLTNLNPQDMLRWWRIQRRKAADRLAAAERAIRDLEAFLGDERPAQAPTPTTGKVHMPGGAEAARRRRVVAEFVATLGDGEVFTPYQMLMATGESEGMLRKYTSLLYTLAEREQAVVALAVPGRGKQPPQYRRRNEPTITRVAE